MQFVRKSTQIFVVLLTIGVPLAHLDLVDRYARASFSYSLASRQISDTGWIHRKALDVLDAALGGLDRPERIFESVSGSAWSLDIMGFNISDPLAAVTASIAGMEFYWPFMLSILPLALLSVFLGRVYCGWLCPYHFMAEINNKLRDLFTRLGLNSHDVQLKKTTRYIILGTLLAVSFLSGVSLFPHIYPPVVVSREVFYYIFYGTVGFGTFFVLFLLLTELTLSERWWCRYACPGGAIYSILGSVRLLRMVRVEEKCTLCIECDRVCPFGLFPMSDKMGMDCDNCGLCREACSEDALVYRVMSLWSEKKMLKERMEIQKEKRAFENGTNG